MLKAASFATLLFCCAISAQTADSWRGSCKPLVVPNRQAALSSPSQQSGKGAFQSAMQALEPIGAVGTLFAVVSETGGGKMAIAGATLTAAGALYTYWNNQNNQNTQKPARSAPPPPLVCDAPPSLSTTFPRSQQVKLIVPPSALLGPSASQALAPHTALVHPVYPDWMVRPTKPSFPCEHASNATESAICSDSKLAEADNAMTAAYVSRLNRSSRQTRALWRENQRSWLALYEQRCSAQIGTGQKICIARSLQARTAELLWSD